MAVSIDLLDFYSALFDRSADAVTALAGALKSLYSRRGFPILNNKVRFQLLCPLTTALLNKPSRTNLYKIHFVEA